MHMVVVFRPPVHRVAAQPHRNGNRDEQDKAESDGFGVGFERSAKQDAPTAAGHVLNHQEEHAAEANQHPEREPGQIRQGELLPTLFGRGLGEDQPGKDGENDPADEADHERATLHSAEQLLAILRGVPVGRRCVIHDGVGHFVPPRAFSVSARFWLSCSAFT